MNAPNPLRSLLNGMTLGQVTDILFGPEPETPAKAPENPAEPRNTSTGGIGRGVPRRFLLRRSVDHSGVSGTGDVASGVEFPDGTVVVRWFGRDPSTSLWKDAASLEAIHGHSGDTKIVWMD